MANAIWERLRFFQACASTALEVIVLSWALFGGFVLVQQEILPHPYCDYRLFDLRWYEWTIALLILLFVSAVEALYQYGRVPAPAKPLLYDHRGAEYVHGQIRRGRVSKILFPLLVAVALLVFTARRYRETPSNELALVTPSSTPAPTSMSSPAPTPEYYPIPLTLRNLFDTDFAQMHITQDVIVHHISPAPELTFTLTYQLIWDFDARTEYIAVYIPRAVDTVIAARSVAEGYQDAINQINQRVQASARSPGESADTASTDLTFSGRVYLYYEDELPLDQMATLEQFYKVRGLSVEFRSHTWNVLHQHDKREVSHTYFQRRIGH